MSKKDRSVYMRHAYDCILRIEQYTHLDKAQFFDDIKTQDAVIRNIEIIGQSIKDFGVEDLVADDDSIPWNQIAGMRNILAHQYLGVDLNITWAVVETYLPALKASIEQVAANLGIDLTE